MFKNCFSFPPADVVTL